MSCELSSLHRPVLFRNTDLCASPVSNMINKLSGQPESYEKKYESFLGRFRARDPCSSITERHTSSEEP